MPIKHQSNSYRNRDGKLYRCWGDFSPIPEGKNELKRLKLEGKDAFGETHKDGYYRIFLFDQNRQSIATENSRALTSWG